LVGNFTNFILLLKSGKQTLLFNKTCTLERVGVGKGVKEKEEGKGEKGEEG
jgi:hypothetical protein